MAAIFDLFLSIDQYFDLPVFWMFDSQDILHQCPMTYHNDSMIIFVLLQYLCYALFHLPGRFP